MESINQKDQTNQTNQKDQTNQKNEKNQTNQKNENLPMSSNVKILFVILFVLVFLIYLLNFSKTSEILNLESDLNTVEVNTNSIQYTAQSPGSTDDNNVLTTIGNSLTVNGTIKSTSDVIVIGDLYVGDISNPFVQTDYYNGKYEQTLNITNLSVSGVMMPKFNSGWSNALTLSGTSYVSYTITVDVTSYGTFDVNYPPQIILYYCPLWAEDADNTSSVSTPPDANDTSIFFIPINSSSEAVTIAYISKSNTNSEGVILSQSHYIQYEVDVTKIKNIVSDDTFPLSDENGNVYPGGICLYMY